MDLLESIKGRRSINFFDPNREIPTGKIEDLLKIANLAPSSFNLQPWEVIVVKTKQNKARLKRLAFNQPKVEEASAVFILIANPYAVEDNLDTVLDIMIKRGYIKNEERDHYKSLPFKLYGKQDSETRIHFAIKNTAFFAMNLMNAARGLELETHPMDGINSEGIKEEFKIDKHKIIPLLLAVGYAKKDLQLLPRGYRRDLEKFVKYE
ncbi:MAG: nitroreductase family protein [Oligoflexia bacterium]|nr:nitroreductase family protein [Oligoflexia bacterium]